LSVSFVEDPRDKFHDTTEPTRKDQHATTMSFANNHHHHHPRPFFPPAKPASRQISESKEALVIPLPEGTSIPDAYKDFPSTMVHDNNGNTYKAAMVPPEFAARFLSIIDDVDELKKKSAEQGELIIHQGKLILHQGKLIDCQQKVIAHQGKEIKGLKAKKQAVDEYICDLPDGQNIDLKLGLQIYENAIEHNMCYSCQESGNNYLTFQPCDHSLCWECLKESNLPENKCPCGAITTGFEPFEEE
jgi:hypothetical protein